MKRNIKSFEADPDVNRMLIRAQRKGIKLGKICNKALRAFLRDKGYAKKRDLIPEEAA